MMIQTWAWCLANQLHTSKRSHDTTCIDVYWMCNIFIYVTTHTSDQGTGTLYHWIQQRMKLKVISYWVMIEKKTRSGNWSNAKLLGIMLSYQHSISWKQTSLDHENAITIFNVNDIIPTYPSVQSSRRYNPIRPRGENIPMISISWYS